jgi:tetratricopeptide (TPR) repeat protein
MGPLCKHPIVLLLSSVLLLATRPGAWAGERYALLVGVRQYNPDQLRPLPFAEADVVELARVLRDSGYQPENLTLMTQTVAARAGDRLAPRSDEIRRQLRLLLRDRTADDTVVLAFAGHGVQLREGDTFYFCPSNADLSDPQTLLSLTEVYQELEKCKAGFKLLLVDACRNDPVAKASRARREVALTSRTRPQAQEPPGGVVAFFSCSPGEEAFEHPDLKHGLFFHFVIEGLRGAAVSGDTAEVTLPELELFVKRRVSDFARSRFSVRQMPELTGHSRGLVPLVRLDRARPRVETRAALERGKALYHRHEYAAAITALDEAVRLNPASAEAYAFRTQARVRNHDLEVAVADGNEAVRLDPNSALAHASRAAAEDARQDIDRALTDAEEAVRLDPKLALGQLVRGKVLADKRDFVRALADLDEAVRLDPRLALAYWVRGLTYGMKGEPDRGLADANEAIRLDPRDPQAYGVRGLLYSIKGDLEDALPDLNEFLRLDPRDPTGYFLRGKTYIKRGDLDRALTDLDEAVRLPPKNAQLYCFRGYAYVLKGAADRAGADANEALRLDPSLADAYAVRGCARVLKGNAEAALADLNEALRRDRNNALAYHGQGVLYFQTKDYSRALAALNEAIRLDPTVAKAYYLRGQVYTAMGDANRALLDLNEGIRRDARFGKPRN